MAPTKYTKSVSSDFPNGVAPDRLEQDIAQDPDIVTALFVSEDEPSGITVQGDNCDIWFKDVLSTEEQSALTAVCAAHSGEPLPAPVQTVEVDEPKSASGIALMEPMPREGSSLVVVTHNWCDPTSWYTQSERVDDEELTTSDDLTFSSAHENWIDLTHGKIYREDLIAASYVPVVKVDGVVKEERAPWATSGGDYSVDYATGEVTFFESQAGKTVTASYSYANGSLFIIAPAAGKRLWVEYSEVQFSKDIDLKSNTYFQPWAYNPADPPNKIAASDPTTYKTLDNYIEEANGTYPAIPAMGGTRGFSQDRLTFPFKYGTVKELKSSLGVEIRVRLEDNVPYGGEYGTATFYCTSYDEG